MQHRMRTHPLTEMQINQLLAHTATGSLATLNEDGSPYVTPVHYVHLGDALYVHGLPKGQKIDNITADSRVSMTVFEMDGLLLDPDENPCDTNTKYQSVIVAGTASLLDDMDHKKEILGEIVKKYTPQLAEKTLPENMIKGTAVIQIQINRITGKYYG